MSLFDCSWHLECSCTMGWRTGLGGPSGPDDLDVVGGVEADLAAAQLPLAPALLVLLAQLQQLLAWKEEDGEFGSVETRMRLKARTG